MAAPVCPWHRVAPLGTSNASAAAGPWEERHPPHPGQAASWHRQPGTSLGRGTSRDGPAASSPQCRSGQQASHELGPCCRQFPDKQPLFARWMVRASRTRAGAPANAATHQPWSDLHWWMCPGWELGTRLLPVPGGYVSPGIGRWVGSDRQAPPPAHHSAPDPTREDPPARCQLSSAPQRDPRQRLRGPGEPVGPAGQERAGTSRALLRQGRGTPAPMGAGTELGTVPDGCSKWAALGPSPAMGAR